ncbi:MAG TPA: PEP-CTERM sorting domain-containing protein, partial [Planctomycetota bacterium]|nr:PEP-CTERM sorting domain-containing protein [Planctomycetota bacterium]
LNPNSQNWAHKLPGQEGYPLPDDFHIFFIAYNYVPEPATFVLMGTGLAVGTWLRRRKRRTG